MSNIPFPLPWIFAAAAFVLLLALLFALLRGPHRPPYQLREDFLTPAELAFFRVLERAAEGRWYIFTKVRLADLLCVAEGTENSRGWFARIGQKHVDFVLADLEKVTPVLVIELDDSSHERADRVRRDEFVDSALDSAGLPILRVKAAREYGEAELAGSIGERVMR